MPSPSASSPHPQHTLLPPLSGLALPSAVITPSLHHLFFIPSTDESHGLRKGHKALTAFHSMLNTFLLASP